MPKKKTFWLLYTLIITLAFVLRFYRLGDIPTGIYWDEVAILADAKKIAATGTDLHGGSAWQLIYPSYGDYKLAPYIWATTFFVRLFGANPFVLRLSSALAGLLTVIGGGLVAYLFSFTLTQDRRSPLPHIWQLTTMLLISITPYSVLFSRTGFEGHLAQALLSWAVVCLLAFYHYHPPKKLISPTLLYLVASGLLAGLAFWTYFSVRFVWPVVFLLIACFYLFLKKNWSQFFLSALVVGSIFSVMFVVMTRDPLYQVSNHLRLSTPSLLNNPDLPHQVNWQRQLAGNTLPARLLFTQKSTQLTGLLQNYAKHLNFGFLFLTGDTNLRHSTTFTGLFYLTCFPFLIWGCIALGRRQPLLLLTLVGWWLVALLPASVPTTGVPHALRSLNSLVPISLLISFGLTTCWFHLAAIHLSWRRFWLGLVVVCFYLETTRFLFLYYRVYPTLSAPDWQTPSLTHADILHQAKSQADRLYALNLDQFLYLWYLIHPDITTDYLQNLPASTNYRFPELDSVSFTYPTTNPQPGDFYLGPAVSVHDFLRHHPDLAYSALYDYREADTGYLGILITDPDATSSTTQTTP